VEERVAVEPPASVTPAPEIVPPDPEPEPALMPEPEPVTDTTLTSDTDSANRIGEEEGEAVPAATAAAPARYRADPGAAARMFDAATATRRRSVVFEEDDELDVPDFLK
jgi:hypothetical protein